MRLDSPPDGGPRRHDAEFGPGGYLPRRAADRARKIVLRERMALSWPIAALVAGLIVLGAGTAFLLRGGPPDAPFVAVTELQALADDQAEVVPAEGGDLLVVRAGGAIHAFVAPDRAVRWCARAQRLEGVDGAVWQVDGRRVGGDAPSLRPVPTAVHSGVVYAAVQRAAAPPPPADRGETPACETP